ncbi:transglycosylase SLT domain-containing protein [bacterium]|nr:transglycosylase SLT domain-containing protein [bacterium]
MSKNNQRYYTQGLNFILQKDYQNAYYNFSSVERGNDYYCPSKYRAALAAQNLYDKNSASIMYKEVINSCQNTLFEENSRYNLAKLYFEQKEYKKAHSLFDILANSAKTEKYKIAANYFLGEILSDTKPQTAVSHFLKYLELSPDGKFSKESIEGVLKLNLSLNAESNFILGKALFANGRFESAKKYLLLVPIDKSWFYLTMSARKLGDYEQAKSFLLKGLTDYTEKLNENDLHAAIDFYALFAPTKKQGYLNAVELLEPQSAIGGDYALYMYIDTLPSKDKMPYYHKIYEKYPQGRFASDALWNIIHSQYKKGNYKKVVELAEEHSKKYANTVAAPRVLFFAAKASEKNHQYSKAKTYYNRILDKYPDDYYAFRSKLLLDGRKTAWTFKGKRQINNEKERINFPINYCNIDSKDKPTFDLLMKAGDFALIEDLLGDNEIIKSWINYKQGNKALSTYQAREFISKLETKPKFDDDVYKLAYPLYFVEEINNHSIDFDLDPYVVIAIIKEESHFDTGARSYVGAGGLMQVMPDTASFIATKYGIPYNATLRNNVDNNIQLGCAYLDFALSQLSKKYLFAVAGYNGGHNAVKKWNETLKYTDYDEFVEEIPFSETQNYIRKVFRSYWNYLNIYDNID